MIYPPGMMLLALSTYIPPVSRAMTNVGFCGAWPKVCKKIMQRRLRLTGHCAHHTELGASTIILWNSVHGDVRRGKLRHTYIDNLIADTGLEYVQDLDAHSWEGR